MNDHLGSPFPYVAVEGAPYERGVQYGRKAAERIRKSLEVYLPAFAERGLDWPKVRTLAQRFGATLEGYDAQLYEELRGIAAGAELEIERIVALNARTELLYWRDEGCTGAACLPEVTRSGHTLLGQNWDWRPACKDTSILLHVQPESGPEFITFVEAGLMARSGLNSAGIGICGNFLQSDQDFGRSGVPIPFVRRKILQSSSMAEALGHVLRTPRAFSSNHLIAHAGGEAIDCEAAPEEVFIVYPEQGILEHSNHFRSPAAQAKLRDTGVPRYPDTLYRDRRVRRILATKAPQIDVEDYHTALRDHYGLPNSVCRHPAERADGTTIATVASVVMDLNEGHLWVAPGPVCEQRYAEYRLERRLTHAVR